MSRSTNRTVARNTNETTTIATTATTATADLVTEILIPMIGNTVFTVLGGGRGKELRLNGANGEWILLTSRVEIVSFFPLLFWVRLGFGCGGQRHARTHARTQHSKDYGKCVNNLSRRFNHLQVVPCSVDRWLLFYSIHRWHMHQSIEYICQQTKDCGVFYFIIIIFFSPKYNVNTDRDCIGRPTLPSSRRRHPPASKMYEKFGGGSTVGINWTVRRDHVDRRDSTTYCKVLRDVQHRWDQTNSTLQEEYSDYI